LSRIRRTAERLNEVATFRRTPDRMSERPALFPQVS
jgi:hypothetical protein